MSRAKIITLLGFASKSGNLLTGQENVLKSLGKKQIYLVFCGGDVAIGSKEKIIKKTQRLNVPLCSDFTVEQLSQAIGKVNRTVVAITERQFAQKMIALMAELE